MENNITIENVAKASQNNIKLYGKQFGMHQCGLYNSISYCIRCYLGLTLLPRSSCVLQGYNVGNRTSSKWERVHTGSDLGKSTINLQL